MQLSLTAREMAEAFALLHISDEGEINILHGRVEHNSIYIAFKMLIYVMLQSLD